MSLASNPSSLPGRRRGAPRCWFCASTDTMPPFRRSDRVLLISRILPLRWRYCRACARHFIASGRPRS